LNPGTYFVTETIVSDYTLFGLICNPTNNVTETLATRSARIDLASSQTVTCTFYNEPTTAVKLDSFTATGVKKAINLKWKTANDVDKVGFNLYRATAADGVRTKINKDLIPSQVPGSPSGAAYEYTDVIVPKQKHWTYYYWLEDVDINGTRLYGPVSARAK